MPITLWYLPALQVVVVTNSSAAIECNVVCRTTIPFQCMPCWLQSVAIALEGIASSSKFSAAPCHWAHHWRNARVGRSGGHGRCGVSVIFVISHWFSVNSHCGGHLRPQVYIGPGDRPAPIRRPPSPISCPEDHRLLVTIVVKHWPLTICPKSVQCYSNAVMKTTQLTHWIPSSIQFPRLA